MLLLLLLLLHLHECCSLLRLHHSHHLLRWHSLRHVLSHLPHKFGGSLSWHVYFGNLLSWHPLRRSLDTLRSSTLVSSLVIISGCSSVVTWLVKSWLDQSDQLVQDGIDFRSAHKFRYIGGCFLVSLKVSFVSYFFNLDFSHFLNLVVIDVEHLSIEVLEVTFILCS